MEVDWEVLRRAATDVMRRAYVPYSGFPVGAAGLADDGRVVAGCNVENASYGLTLCAECGMVSALHAGGGGRLVAVSCVDRGGAPLASCGRCRQLLAENGGPRCLVDTAHGPRTLADLLPGAFTAADLAAPTAGDARPTGDDSAAIGGQRSSGDPAAGGAQEVVNSPTLDPDSTAVTRAEPGVERGDG